MLAVALLPEFSVRVESEKAVVKRLSVAGQADVIVLDFDSNYSGLSEDNLALFDELQSSGVPIVVMSDDNTRSTALRLMQRSSCDCLRKPPSLVELKIVLHRAYEHACLKQELIRGVQKISQPSPGCEGIIGSSPALQGVYDLIRRVSDLDTFVLITGESGSGKELVARAIHNVGRRSSAPFVTVSCGAVPETLLEAELFGHEKGAYTGTVGSRKGCFEQAENGTVFLDEIGELSLHAQVKLLRVLQEKEFCRLGGNRMIPMTARVLFATHRNLTQMVEEGKFRNDLYFRVNVMQIQVPSLRQRPEDIPILSNHFLRTYGAEYRKPVDQIHPSAMARLMDYDWPGNVRELKNAIARAVIVAKDRSVVLKDLPESLQQEEEVVSIDQPSGLFSSFDAQLRDFKIKLVNRALAEAKGNKTLAARSLCISRAYLHRLLRGSDDTMRSVDEFDAA